MTRAKAAANRKAKIDPPPPEAAAPDRALLAVEYWPLAKLIPYARNARTHSEAQVAEIAGSIRAFGFANPILVGSEGDIIAGHGRLAAARQLGMESVPVIVLAGLSETQRRQLVLADNRIAMNAGWDMDMLRFELRDLRDLAVDLRVLAFDTKELAAILTGDPSGGLTDEDEIPDAVEEAVSRAGDIWFLGAHRLACLKTAGWRSVSQTHGHRSALWRRI